jgi:hypothetical protein
VPDLPVLPAPPRLPGHAQMLIWSLGSLAVSMATGVLVLAVSGSAAAAWPLFVAAWIGVLLGPPIRRARLRNLLADPRYRTVPDGQAGLALAAALAPTGVRALVVRAGPVSGLARNYRDGPRAVLLVHEVLLDQPDLAGFFIAHEAVHLARNDIVRRPVVFSAALTSWVFLAFAWPVAVLALPLLIALAAVFNQAMELSCDRQAAHWVGFDQAERALSVLVVARRREHRPPVRVFRGLLTYPSPRRRVSAVAAASALHDATR